MCLPQEHTAVTSSPADQTIQRYFGVWDSDKGLQGKPHWEKKASCPGTQGDSQGADVASDTVTPEGGGGARGCSPAWPRLRLRQLAHTEQRRQPGGGPEVGSGPHRWPKVGGASHVQKWPTWEGF